jgi:hypothetical protein
LGGGLRDELDYLEKGVLKVQWEIGTWEGKGDEKLKEEDPSPGPAALPQRKDVGTEKLTSSSGARLVPGSACPLTPPTPSLFFSKFFN